MEKNQIEKVRTQFRKNLTDCGWLEVLEPYIASRRFDILINKLEEAQNKGGLTPILSDIFKVFYECPYDKLKVVITLQEPYPKVGVANGLALCCGKTEVVEPPLAAVFEDIENTVYKDEGGWYLWEEDLKRWSNQGVLLLNETLTTAPGKIGAHIDIWKPFTGFLFSRLAELNTNLIYVFMGDTGTGWIKSIPDSNHVLSCTKPKLVKDKKKEKPWESGNVFVIVNELIEKNNGIKIIW